MYKRKNGIMGKISALTLGVILAANSFTAFAAGVSGDVNADGKTDVTDIAVTAAHIKGIKALDSEAAVRADIDGDGKINVTDIAMLAAHIKGIKALPETEREPVYELKTLSGASLIGSAKGRLVIRKDLTGGDPTAKSSYEYKVINAKTEKTERTIKSGVVFDLVGIKQDGTLIMSGYVKDKGTALYFFAEGSDEPVVQQTGMEYPRIAFDEKNETIYLDVENVIYKLTAEGKLEELVKTADDRDMFVNMDAADMVTGISYSANTNPELSKVGVISLATGKTRWETVQHDGSIAFSQHHAILYDSLSMIKDDVMTSELRCFDKETGKKQGVYETDGSVSRIFTSAGTDNIIIGKTEPMDSVFIFDTSTGEVSNVDLGIREMNIVYAAYMGEDVWAVNVSYAVEDAFEVKTFIIDAVKQEYTKLPEGHDVETMEEFQLKTCGEALKAQREKADELEKKYGVTILIGDEVLNVNIKDDSSPLFTSAETDMDEDYPERLDKILDGMDIWMSAYPDGFFEKFKTDSCSGMRIELPKTIMQDEFDETGKVDGYTFYDSANGYINIAIREGHEENTNTFDHEMWHAVEYITAVECGEIDKAEWSKLQPDGFGYVEELGEAFSYSKFAKNRMDAVDCELNDDEIYFIRRYSFTNDREDRATLMELIYPSMTVYESYRNVYNNYPKLKAKIDYMGEWSKQYFGYVYWEEMEKINKDRQLGSNVMG